ncbi:MAG: GIY-YIG nuclease family protein [Planctomycetota bacterium]|nr:MAG: GIY-YIG nuclease family protein [Planctomycetota bacterium]
MTEGVEAGEPEAKKSWWVYMLRCADGTLYTGVSTDAERRLTQHNAGTASRYTRARLPVKMIWRETQSGHGDALRRETAIKKLSRAEKLRLARPRRKGAP